MKVIFKNSKLVFAEKVVTPITPSQTVGSKFLDESKKIQTAGSSMTLKIYQLSAGENYLIKPIDDYSPFPQSVTLINFAIGFSESLVTTSGSFLPDGQLVLGFSPYSENIDSIEYTPSANGYLYVTTAVSETSGANIDFVVCQ